MLNQEQKDFGDWQWSGEHRSICRILETEPLWGHQTCHVWLPGQDSVIRIHAERLKPLSRGDAVSSDGIIYVAAAARVADALT